MSDEIVSVKTVCEAGRWSGFEKILYRCALVCGVEVTMYRIVKGWIEHSYFFTVTGTRNKSP